MSEIIAKSRVTEDDLHQPTQLELKTFDKRAKATEKFIGRNRSVIPVILRERSDRRI